MTDAVREALRMAAGPRALPPALRARLAQSLTQALADGVVTDDSLGPLLGNIDAERPLPDDVRSRLRDRLARPQPTVLGGARRFRGDPRLLAAAAALLAVVGSVTVASTGTRHHPAAVRAGSAPTAPPIPTGTGSGGVTGATGGAATGTAAGGTGRAPRPAASHSAQALQSGSGTSGYAAAAPASGPNGVGASVTPLHGPLTGGTRVTISGQMLGSAREVRFGDQPAQRFTVRSPHTVTAVSPSVDQPQTVDVTVTLQSGRRVRIANGFTYLAPPAVAQVKPAYGPTNGGTWVTIDGTALAFATSVRFGDVAAGRVVPVSASEVRALAPPHSAGRVDVVVTTPGGTSRTSTNDGYLYVP